MPLTSGEIAKLRDTHPHIVIPYLSIHKPRTVYTVTVDSDTPKGEIKIPVTPLSGSWLDVKNGMTVIIAKASPLATQPLYYRRRRLKSKNLTGYLVLDESGLDLEAGDIMYVKDNFELWSVFPKIEPATAHTQEVYFYKDFDIPYNTMAINASPVAIIDGPRCVASDTLPIQIQLSGYRSYGVNTTSSVTIWNWDCDFCTFDDPTLPEPTLTFNSYYPDGVWVELQVEDNHGSVFTTRRLVFIHSRTGANAPYTDFTFNQLVGDWEQGSWRASLTLHGNINTDVPEGAHVILWHDAIFGNYTSSSDTDDYLGSQTEILNEGIISMEEPTYTETGDMQTVAHIQDIVEQLKKRKMFSISLNNVLTATNWTEYVNLTVTRALHHLYRWHSTLLEIANVILPAETEVAVLAVEDFKAGELYQMGDTFAREYSIFAHLVADKMGTLYGEVEFNMLSDLERGAIPIELQFIDGDLRGDPVVKFVRNTIQRVWIIEVSGTYYDTATSTPLIAAAPGEVPDALGHKEVKLERLVFADASSDHLSKAGRVYALLNAEIERITLFMSGNYTFMDLMPQRRYYLALSSDQTGRGPWEGYMVPRNISIKYDQETGIIEQKVEFEPEVQSFDGANIPVPDPPPAPPPPDPIKPPDWPDLPGPNYGDGFGTVYVMVDDALWRTRDFSATPATWTQIVSTGTMIDFILDPWNPYANGMLMKSDGVYRSTDLTAVSPSFSTVLTAAQILSATGLTVWNWGSIKGSPNFQDYYVVSWLVNNASNIDSYVSYTYDAGVSWNHTLVRASSGNANYSRHLNWVDVVPHAVGAQPHLYALPGVQLYYSTDGGASWSLIATLTQNGFYNAADGLCVHVPYHDNADGRYVYTCIADSRPATYHRDYHLYDRIAATEINNMDWGGAGRGCSRWNIESYTNDRLAIYMIAGNTMAISDDGGATWGYATMNGYSSGGTEIEASGGFPTTGDQFYLVSGGGVFVSVDRGENWVEKAAGAGMKLNTSRAVIVPLWLEE